MPTRRAFLGGLGAAAGSAALAGCSGNPLGGDGGSDASEYTDWMPDVGRDTVAFSVIDADDVAAAEDLPEDALPDQQYGVDVENIDLNVRYLEADIFVGSFDAPTIRDGMENESGVTFQEDGEYGDFQRYSVDAADVAIGIQDGSAVLAPSDQFEPIVDAHRGEEDRLVDTSDDLELLTDELGSGDIVTGGIRSGTDAGRDFFAENELASGQRVEVDGSETEQTHVFVFTTADDVDESGVRERYENRSNATDVTSSVDGRVATVSYTIPISEFF